MINLVTYRAQSKPYGVWVSGFIAPASSDSPNQFAIIETPRLGRIVWYPVDTCTINQCAMAIDSHNRMIYQGDFLKARDGEIGLVVLRRGSPVLITSRRACSFNSRGFNPSAHTIVGNIYDNPELIPPKWKDYPRDLLINDDDLPF